MTKSQPVHGLEYQIANLRGLTMATRMLRSRSRPMPQPSEILFITDLSRNYSASTISAVKIALQAVAALTPAGPVLSVASRGIE